MAKGHMKVVHHHHKRNPSPAPLAPLDIPAFISSQLQDESSSSSERLSKRQNPIPAACSTGGFITSPSLSSTINPLSPLPVAWLPTCLPSTKSVDIYLFAPGLEPNPRIQRFTSIPNNGSVNLDVMPRWWGAKQGQELQIQVMPANVEVFLAEFPPGPVFKAEWEDVADEEEEGGRIPEALDTNRIDTGVTVVGAKEETSSLKSGKTAVAVLIPLLVIGLGVWAFFKWKRKREVEKRKTWAEQVDKRMSTISTDWKSVTVPGAQAAIRNSMAANRASMAGRSSFSFGNIRPASTFGGEESMNEKNGFDSGIDATQRRPGVGLRNPSTLSGVDRQSRGISRVSFADQAHPRPSFSSQASGDRRTKTFRDDYVPPVPQLPTSSAPARRPSNDSESDIASGTVSPTQAVGPITLTPEDIRARIAAGRARADSAAKTSIKGVGLRKTSVEKDRDRGMSEMDGDVLPALKMMRTNSADDDSNDNYLLSSGPTPPAATYPKPVTGVSVHMSGEQGGGATPLSPTLAASRAMTMSPVMSTMPMQAIPASVMSPDDMLRAYAERKKSGGGGMSISYPQPPAPSAPAPGGRTLFSGMVSPTHTGETPVPKVPQLGFGVGEYDANFSFGQQQSTGNGLTAPPSPLGKRASSSNNPYFAHAQQAYSAPQQDPYGGYDAAYGGGAFAVGEVENEEGDVVENRAGRGAYGRK